MTKKNLNLTSEQKLVMFEDGTEAPGTSELNNEKREGTYHCANCGNKLFNSSTKYESGSGWPSFYAVSNPPSLASVPTQRQKHGTRWLPESSLELPM